MPLDFDQRRTVAFKPCSDNFIAMLALSDSDESVRCSVMFSPAITDDQVAWHRDNDPSESVRDAAAEAIGTELGRYLRSGDRYLEDDCDDE